MAIKNDLLLRAALGEKTERPPVWLMRQAGRILPEYRALRAKLSGFKELVETPELACEVTLQPVYALGVDAAIIFSDILVVPEAMGYPYEMIEKVGPRFPKTIRNEKDIDALMVPNIKESLGYVLEAIKLTKKELDDSIPLIGFAGAPLTILAYLVDGGGSKTFSETRKLLYQRPDLAHKALQKITDTTILYLKEQIACGINLAQLFDSWAGIFATQQYNTFGVPYLAQIAEAITEVPLTLFAKGALFSYEELAKTNCQTIGVDWSTPIDFALKHSGTKTLQGNLDPTLLYADNSVIEKNTNSMLKAFASRPHIANLGHGVYPDTPLDGVKCFIETVKKNGEH
jgi:uroporphyrinogen decarboxylase